MWMRIWSKRWASRPISDIGSLWDCYRTLLTWMGPSSKWTVPNRMTQQQLLWVEPLKARHSNGTLFGRLLHVFDSIRFERNNGLNCGFTQRRFGSKTTRVYFCRTLKPPVKASLNFDVFAIQSNFRGKCTQHTTPESTCDGSSHEFWCVPMGFAWEHAHSLPEWIFDLTEMKHTFSLKNWKEVHRSMANAWELTERRGVEYFEPTSPEMRENCVRMKPPDETICHWQRQWFACAAKNREETR